MDTPFAPLDDAAESLARMNLWSPGARRSAIC